MIENILSNLIASAIGAIILFVAGKLLTDFYFIGFSFTSQKVWDMLTTLR